MDKPEGDSRGNPPKTENGIDLKEQVKHFRSRRFPSKAKKRGKQDD